MGREQHCGNQLSPLTFILRRYYLISTRGVYLLRPRDEHCFCLRPLLRKPQQTDGRYRDLLITDTLTFKAVSLSLCGEEWILHHILSAPHNQTAAKKKRQHAISRAQKNVGQEKDQNLRKMLHESPHFFLFTDSKEDEYGSHFLLIKVVFSVKQPHCLSLSYGVIAHPKLSHLLSQWVSWAQGVWDVAVCWGRGKLCENCVGEAKKNITAWQQRCREWRTRRRSGGAREGGVECMGMGMTEGKVGVYVCVHACVCVGGWGWLLR